MDFGTRIGRTFESAETAVPFLRNFLMAAAHAEPWFSLLLFLAALFFTGAVWALARDGVLDFDDGLVLVGLFVFWQVLHIFDVLKHNVYRGKSLKWSMLYDMVLVVAGGMGVYEAIERLVSVQRHYPVITG